MAVFEKEFSWCEFIDKCKSGQKIAVINNKSMEPRNYVKEFSEAIHNKCNVIDIELAYDPENDGIINGNKTISAPDALKEKIHTPEELTIVINITTMNLRLLGAILKYLKFNECIEIYCLYTEPRRYARNQDNTGNFDLYRRMKSHDPILGYVSTNINHKPEKWIPFLGFEGKRALSIMNEYEFDDLVPVITLPCYKPMWQNIIIRENLFLLDNIKGSSIHYVEANSIAAAYDELSSLSTIYPDSLLRVSPFGTKINALGILLYALSHEGEIDIVYDNPIEDGAAISKDVGKTHIFDITEYIEICKGDDFDGINNSN